MAVRFTLFKSCPAAPICTKLYVPTSASAVKLNPVPKRWPIVSVPPLLSRVRSLLKWIVPVVKVMGSAFEVTAVATPAVKLKFVPAV